MAVLEKTWYTDLNYQADNDTTAAFLAKSVLWAWKAFLKGEIGVVATGLWTCEGSSDSVTAGMDATDRWGATFDGTKIVRASGAVAHSWIVLKSPNAMGPYRICIQYNSTLDEKCVVVFSKASFTGGSITARPTATDEWTYSVARRFCDTGATPSKIHCSRDADGNFFLLYSADSGGSFQGCLALQTLAETRPTDDYKAVSIWTYDTVGGGCLTAYFHAAVTNNHLFCGQNVIAAAAGVRCRRYDGAEVNEGEPIIPVIYCNTPTAVNGSQMFNAFAITAAGGNATADPQDGKWNDFPIYVQTHVIMTTTPLTATGRGLKGRFYDLKWGPTGLTQGSLDPATSPYTTMVVGQCYLPIASTTAPSL